MMTATAEAPAASIASRTLPNSAGPIIPAIAAAVMAVAFASSQTVAQNVELTVSSWVPPTHAINTDMTKPWMEQVSEATQGRVALRMLPTAVASPREHFDAIRNGLADVTKIEHLLPGIIGEDVRRCSRSSSGECVD
jgi:TRAP-type mannitol/chloroaromatic compound transport system substrate-binding protein